MSITAVIPVRAGSRRLENKNVAPFAGTNLLIHKIEQLKKVKEIDDIVVSSDSDSMLDMAKTKGVKTHKRAIEYCDEKTKSFGEVVGHIAENVGGTHILWATCTCPLVFPETYSEAVKQYFIALSDNYDSLISFEILKRYIWNEEGPINYNIGLKHVPSQELPALYAPTFGITIAPRRQMIEWNYFHGTNPYKFIIDKRSSIDIDDGLDLAVARAWLDI
ncbi:MAG: NTP transferase domain-containing protein [Oscillospiraceae bacterium]|nr:NTP transferase domain-containing protein [Oscillospiraceae bacterium]